MADIGHERTDKLIKETEKKVAREYAKAQKEVQRKLERYFARVQAEAEEKRQQYEAGEISLKDYKDWILRKTAMGKRWEDLRDNLAEDYHNANQIAKSIVKGYQADAYALNHNYATYQIEHDGGIDSFYTLYDKETVERLIRDDQILMPPPGPKMKAQIAANKDMQWNMQQLQSALTQAVLQGESIPEFAKRISNTVAVRNYNSSVRYARTMMTSAENAGRYDGYRRATKMGIDLTIEWSATLDGRTRHDHRMMHGQRRNVDEPFETPDGFKIYYPADCTGESDAPQNEIWNCRCTLLAWVKGFEGDTVKSSPKMGEMTFDEWQHEHEKREEKKPEEFKLTVGKHYDIKDLKTKVVDDFEFPDGTAYGVRKKAKAVVYTVPNGVEFVFPKTYNKKNQTLTVEQLLNAYNRVPSEIRDKGQKRIIVNDVYNPQDSYWKKMYKNFTHSYMVGGKNIDIWRASYHDDDYLVEALSHEMGHWIDWRGEYLTGKRFSEGPEWAEAMAKDLEISSRKSPTRYGENSPAEDLAESFARLTFNIDDFAEQFPNRYELIKGLLS